MAGKKKLSFPCPLDTASLVLAGINVAGPRRDGESDADFTLRREAAFRDVVRATAGGACDEAYVAARQAALAEATRKGSTASREVRYVETLRNATVIPATITGVQRVVREGPDGHEFVRARIVFASECGRAAGQVEDAMTEVCDDWHPGARLLANTLRAMVGQTVLLWRYNEPDQTGQSSNGFRMVAHVEQRAW